MNNQKLLTPDMIIPAAVTVGGVAGGVGIVPGEFSMPDVHANAQAQVDAYNAMAAEAAIQAAEHPEYVQFIDPATGASAGGDAKIVTAHVEHAQAVAGDHLQHVTGVEVGVWTIAGIGALVLGGMFVRNAGGFKNAAYAVAAPFKRTYDAVRRLTTPAVPAQSPTTPDLSQYDNLQYRVDQHNAVTNGTHLPNARSGSYPGYPAL